MKWKATAALLLIVTSLLSWRLFFASKPADSGLLRIAFPYNKPATEYEPTDIRFAPQYVFLHNIYRTLIEFAPENGDIVGAVSDNFYWKDGELHLHIRDNLKTVDGFPITAADVVFSLKRVMVLSGNTHGNIKSLLCEGPPLKSVQEDCSGIRQENDEVILKTAKESLFLLPMLAEIDFAIIPQRAVDPKTLKIVDYRNTSGPYYVEADDPGGRIRLKANPYHFHYSDRMPQTVQLVPAGVDGGKNSIELWNEDQIDLITNVDKLNPDRVIEFVRSTRATLHSTMSLRSYLLIFTSKGLKRWNVNERLAIGAALKKGLRAHLLTKPGFESTDQVFPNFGDGALPPEEAERLKEIDRGIEPPAEVAGGATVAVLRIDEVSEIQKAVDSVVKGVRLSPSNKIPGMEKGPVPDMPDLLFAAPDTGYMEDIGLISYALNMGIFGLDRAQAEKWLSSYMKMKSKEERFKRLRELHLNTLKNGFTVPVARSPYVAAIRPEWRIGYSQIFADESLWRIKRN